MKNLKVIYQNADKSGFNWYCEANQFCEKLADKYQLPLVTVCAVVSSLSPGTNWEQNKKDAMTLIENRHGNRKQKFTTYGQNVVKAYRILDGEVKPEEAFSLKTGAKTYNFFYNVWKPDLFEYVTIDRHAYRIATGKEYERITPKQYHEIAGHYMRTAKRLNILPNQLQAVLWVDYRKRQEIQFREFVPF